jgi:hypothetical protein
MRPLASCCRQITALLAVILSVVTGCATMQIRPGLVVIRFAQDSVPLERTAEAVRFRVTTVIRNDNSTPIVFGGCSPDVQRSINGIWTTVWSPTCFSEQSATLMPGDSLILPLIIGASTKPNMEPQLDPRMTAGEYRLRFGVSFAQGAERTSASPLEIRESPPFIVYESASK